MAITDYDILTATSIAEMKTKVAAAMADDWIPQGAEQAIPQFDGNLQVRSMVVYQTMFKGSPAAVEVVADLAAIEAAITAYDARLDALEATIDTATTGLSDVVADHESRIAVLEAA